MILKPRLFRKPRRGHWATKGLVGGWLFNEDSGNTVQDLSGSGNDITLVGGDVVWSSGKFGSALSYPGSNGDYGEGPYTGNLNLTGTFTLVAHINTDNITNQQGFMAKYWTRGYYFRILNTGYVLFGILSSGGNGEVTSNTKPTIGKDHLYCAVYDGIDMRIYKDGVLDCSPVAHTNAPSSSIQAPFILGARQGGSFAFDGRYNYAMVYARPLSAGENAELHAKPFAMFERDPIELWVGATSVEVGAPPLLLAGSIAAQSTVTGDTDSIEILQGSLAGQSTSFAEIKSTKAIAGLVEVQSGAAGNLQWLKELAGLIEGQSGVTGNLQWLQELAGLIEVQSSVAGDIIIAGILSLGGTIAAQVTLTAKLREINSLSGSLAAQSSVTGNLQWLLELAGSIGAQSGIVGKLQWLQELAGLIEVQSSSAGNILSTEMLAGLIETQSSVAGLLKTIELLTGEIAAQSSLIGYIQLGGITYKVPIITGTPLVTGDVLRWDGSNWVNFAGLNLITVDDLPDPAVNGDLIRLSINNQLYLGVE